LGKILVTGASGIVGRHTLLHLLKQKSANQLVGLVRDLSNAEDLTAKGIELRQGTRNHSTVLSLGSTSSC
jgi:NAD(P)H dehydrogenase (quinone)